MNKKNLIAMALAFVLLVVIALAAYDGNKRKQAMVEASTSIVRRATLLVERSVDLRATAREDVSLREIDSNISALRDLELELKVLRDQSSVEFAQQLARYVNTLKLLEEGYSNRAKSIELLEIHWELGKILDRQKLAITFSPEFERTLFSGNEYRKVLSDIEDNDQAITDAKARIVASYENFRVLVSKTRDTTVSLRREISPEALLSDNTLDQLGQFAAEKSGFEEQPLSSKPDVDQ